jgi:hypothetical protein
MKIQHFCPQPHLSTRVERCAICAKLNHHSKRRWAYLPVAEVQLSATTRLVHFTFTFENGSLNFESVSF